MRNAVVIALLLGGCDAPEATESPRATDADTRDTTSVTPPGRENCHWDCFGRSLCVEGQVTVWLHAPIPCEAWTGECPIRDTFSCERGCRIDGIKSFNDRRDPRELCEEDRPKKAGDPCTTATDCLPTPAVRTSPTAVENTYLRCDADAGRCVAAPPPVVADYLGRCGVDFSGIPTGAYGYVTAPSCSGGVCLIAPTASCTAEGCSIPCAGDHECPAGSVCEGLTNWKFTEGGVSADGVCKPGPRNVIGLSLSCPPISDAGVGD